MKTILIIEDRKDIQKGFKWLLEDKAKILPAFSLEQAMAVLSSQLKIDIIAMDACLSGNTPDTLELTKAIREKGFKGPIIAISSAEDYRLMLIKAGASEGCPKSEFPKYVQKYLSQEEQSKERIETAPYFNPLLIIKNFQNRAIFRILSPDTLRYRDPDNPYFKLLK